MEITLNNQIRITPLNCSVQQLLDDILPGRQNGVAVAVNSQVIHRNSWELHILQPHDNVLIIKATQGG